MGNACKSNKDTSRPANQMSADMDGKTQKGITGNTGPGSFGDLKPNDNGMKIGPDIFVSLRGGSIFDVYKAGPVLGKGTIDLWEQNWF